MNRRLLALLAVGALLLSTLVALAPPSAAAGTGTITGTITPVGVPNPVVGVCPLVGGNLGSCVPGLASVDPTTGAYSIAGLTPGTYVVYASADGYVQTWVGGYPSLNAYEYVPAMTIITVPDGGTTTADIALVQGATVTGAVSPATAPGVWVDVCSLTARECASPPLKPDGTFSVAVLPGSTLIAAAGADGYLQTYLGGCANSLSRQCAVGDQDVTSFDAPSNGQTLGIGVITLVGAATISGTLTPVLTGFDAPNVVICPVETDSVGVPYIPFTLNCRNTPPAADGSFEFGELAPGGKYVMYGEGADYIQTWRGGGVGNNPNLGDPAQVMIMQAPAAGQTLAGQDIVLQKGATITGTVTPTLPDKPGGVMSANVTLCPVLTGADGTRSLDQSSHCTSTLAMVPPGGSAMTYSATVTPGTTYVINARANGYVPTWRGGYVANHDVYELPVAGVTEIIAPADGMTLSGQDIAMVKEATVTGKVILPAGYTLNPTLQVEPNTVQFYTIDTSTGSPNLWQTSTSALIQPDGTYTMYGLVPGEQYVVCVTVLQTLPRSDLLTSCYGGYLGLATHLDYMDATTPGLIPVTAPATGVDITVAQGLTVAGMVYMPDGVTPVTLPDGFVNPDVAVTVSTLGADGSLELVSGMQLYPDGTYSIKLVPGTTYYVGAAATGYPFVWRGGYVGESPTLPNPQVTPVSGTSGQTITGQDITLVGGSSITGALSYAPVDPAGDFPWVEACRVMVDGALRDCQTARLTGPGAYRIDGLVSGVPYVVFGGADGFSRTFYGGLAGFPKLPHAGATPVTTVAAGGVVPNVNITLSKGVTLTGTVFPQPAPKLEVWACPVYADGGQNYYVSARVQDVATPSATATAAVANGPGDVGTYCVHATVDPASRTYTAIVDPGQQYVIVAQATGYTDAWYGGFVGASGLTQSDPSPAKSRPLPVTDQIVLVSGTAGQTVAGLNITFGAAVLVTFDAAGGTPATQVRSVAPGAVTVLPAAPTRAGYDFAGWYTGKDGAGTQFTATTPVGAELTVYAKWTPSHVSPGGGTSIPAPTGAAAIALVVAVAVAGVVSGTVLLGRRRG